MATTPRQCIRRRPGATMPPRSIRAKSARGRDERAIAMNLDTREKRASGVHVGLAWRGLLPPRAARLPDRHRGGDVVDPYLGLGLIGLILVTYYLWRTKPPGDWLE